LNCSTRHQNSSQVLVVFGQNGFSLSLFSLLATASPTLQQNHASATKDYAFTPVQAPPNLAVLSRIAH